jgi:hypothetical protein
VLAVLFSRVAWSITDEENGTEEVEHLAPLAALVGTSWVGEFPGGCMTDTQEFEWMLGRKFLRNVHRVANAEGAVVYEGETIFGWDHRFTMQFKPK